MANVYDAIDERLAAFLTAQKVFFVGTAPSGVDGPVNISPKGLDSFRVLGPTEVAYLDLHGSGAETIAHLRDNGRIVVMACAFDGPPRIVRLHGRGEAVLRDDPRFADLLAAFPTADLPPPRAVVRVDVTRISDSCGWGVPTVGTMEERDIMHRVAAAQDEADFAAAREHNRTSIDGLPALEVDAEG